MKTYILSLILSISQIVANDSIPIKVLCGDKGLQIIIASEKLNLTINAVQDNLGGYVDIPEEKFYLKTPTKVYYLQGIVENENPKAIATFASTFSNKTNNFITPQELYNLKSSKKLKFIQKINLETTQKLTTNTIYVEFEEKAFEREYNKCER